MKVVILLLLVLCYQAYGTTYTCDATAGAGAFDADCDNCVTANDGTTANGACEECVENSFLVVNTLDDAASAVCDLVDTTAITLDTPCCVDSAGCDDLSGFQYLSIDDIAVCSLEDCHADCDGCYANTLTATDGDEFCTGCADSDFIIEAAAADETWGPCVEEVADYDCTDGGAYYYPGTGCYYQCETGDIMQGLAAAITTADWECVASTACASEDWLYTVSATEIYCLTDACPATLATGATCAAVAGTSCTEATDAHVYAAATDTTFTCATVATHTCATTVGSDTVGTATVVTCYTDGFCPAAAQYITLTAAPTDWTLALVGTCAATCADGQYLYTSTTGGFLLCLDSKHIILLI